MHAFGIFVWKEHTCEKKTHFLHDLCNVPVAFITFMHSMTLSVTRTTDVSFCSNSLGKKNESIRVRDFCVERTHTWKKMYFLHDLCNVPVTFIAFMHLMTLSVTRTNDVIFCSNLLGKKNKPIRWIHLFEQYLRKRLGFEIFPTSCKTTTHF